MTRPNFQRAICLTPDENMIVDQLQKQGIKVIEIFRRGLAYYAPIVSEELKAKAKALV